MRPPSGIINPPAFCCHIRDSDGRNPEKKPFCQHMGGPATAEKNLSLIHIFYFGLEGEGRVVRGGDAAATASRKVFRNAVIR